MEKIIQTTAKAAKAKQAVVPAWMKKLDDERTYNFITLQTPFGTYWIGITH